MAAQHTLGPDLRRTIAGAIANARGGRRGAPRITNILDMLPAKLRDEVLDDADAVIVALGPMSPAAPELLQAVQDQHRAIDWLLARLIELDREFLPTKSPVWGMVASAQAVIAKAEGRADG